LTIFRRAREQGIRVLLGGSYGNYTISWGGWSQAADHLLAGRFLTAFRQWRLFYRQFPFSPLGSFFTLFVEPVLPDRVKEWQYWRRHPDRKTPWQDYAAIQAAFAAEMGVEGRASRVGHDFLYRARRGERLANMHPIDYGGEWHAAEKAMAGVELRDPTADIDVVNYCFGVPPEQYLVEGIDRSLIRRAMWGLLPEAVLTSKCRAVQSADWHEKWGRRREELAADLRELSRSDLVRRMTDVERLERALKCWPDGEWRTHKIISEYEMALTRGIAAARFLRWFESKNGSY
jgi:asparagine synthase (glutamine-hydrolysing)